MGVKQDSFDPPSYDELVSPGRGQGPEASANSIPGSSSSSSAHFKVLPSPPLSAGSVVSSSSSSWTSWIPWNRTQKEVNENVRTLVRQIVINIPNANERSGGTASDAAEGILCSCADVCAKHSLSLASILHERYIEGHSPLYWAIIKQTPTRSGRRFSGVKETPDVLGPILSFSLPITRQSTISELRLACLSMSNQSAFQLLRLAVPKFSSLSGTDRILLGPSQILESDVDVTLGSESEGGAFAVDMRFPQFHKRLMVNREIGVEFVARNRIWRFSLMFMKENWSSGPSEGTWSSTLSLQDSSPPTWFNGRLILIDPHGGVASQTSTSQSEGSSGVHLVRMRSFKEYRLESEASSYQHQHRIGVSLENEAAFSSLQYAESSYISEDEVLCLRLEARLTKPSNGENDECTIC
ncbi:hypothetical protein CPB84DRAFT_1791604 [Gymnopilus junonius]|uniref:Uncharacterized protein n=1 Tax=Gymnopilus junonius TaxID=109634 RepID=A0A9P5NCC5_GYMJU|nr:hypothetical protein CPB84DRAFT_1791604 [Gymnopilus junonius]